MPATAKSTTSPTGKSCNSWKKPSVLLSSGGQLISGKLWVVKGPTHCLCVCLCDNEPESLCKGTELLTVFWSSWPTSHPPDIIGVSSTMLHLFLSFSYKVHLTANRLWMMCFLLDYVITHSRLEQLESFCYFKHSTIMLWFCCFPLLWKGLTDCMIDINNIHIYLCQTFQIRSCTILSKISAFTNIWPWVRSHS